MAKLDESVLNALDARRHALRVFPTPAASGSRVPTTPASALWAALRVVVRRKWLAIGGVVLTLIPAMFVISAARPVYRATTRLVVDVGDPSAAIMKGAAEAAAQQGYIETMAELLKGRRLIEQAAVKLKLGSHPDYRTPAEAAPSGAEAAPAAEATPASEPQEVSPGIVDRFLANLAVDVVRGSRVVNVTFQSYDPQLAADGANAVAREFIEMDMESRFASVKDTSGWLGERLAEQRQRVTESEAALQRYRERRDASSLDERQNMVVQRLADLNAAVTKARTERIAKEQLYNQAQAIRNDRGALDTFPVIASSPFIQQLKAQLGDFERQLAQLSETYGERHPEIVRVKTARDETARRLQAEIEKFVESVHNDFLTARAQEQSLSAALDAQKREVVSLDQKGVEYAALTREAESNRELYQSLLQEAKAAGLSTELKRSNIRLLDAAHVPGGPVGPFGASAYALALVGSCVFGFVLVFGAEYLDSRLKTPEDLQHHLNSTFLGYVPDLQVKKGTPRSDLLIERQPAAFGESIRRVRANVELLAAEGARTLLITSTAPKEGKTIVATNLAIALAQAGRKVLLLDADLRRPQVHATLGGRMEPGLATVLVGKTSLQKAVRPSGQVRHLSLLTAGHRPPNPMELLSRSNFEAVLRDLRTEFDWVIIDSPPVMAVADSSVIAPLVDGVIFVVMADSTSRVAAQVAMQQLERTKTNIIGTVLNSVRLPSHVGYLCSPYYNPEYEIYYHATPPELSVPPADQDKLAAAQS